MPPSCQSGHKGFTGHQRQKLHRHPNSSSPLPGASQTLALRPLSTADSLIAECSRAKGKEPGHGMGDHGHQRSQFNSPASYLIPYPHTCPSSLHRSKHETAALVKNRTALRLMKRGQSVGGKRRINWQGEQQSVSERHEERMSEESGEEERGENRGLSWIIVTGPCTTQREKVRERKER